MDRDGLVTDYFSWITSIIGSGHAYTKLLSRLYDTPFIFDNVMDGNREEDGADLRRRFIDDQEYPITRTVSLFLKDRPCSVLEMMVALAIRCEEHIMDDPDIGNRTEKWFWGMIDSLGLLNMRDRNFDIRKYDIIVSRFLNRDYMSNGSGGLFTIPHCAVNLLDLDIWYQMCRYLETII